MFIFNGSAGEKLAKKTAHKLNANLGETKISKFSNDELRVFVNHKWDNGTAIIIQSLSQPVDSNIIEFTLLCDAINRLGAREIIAVIPWMGYSKQDKVFRSGEPLSVKVIAKILQVVPVKKIITFDLHNLAILGFFEVPVTNLSATSLFTNYFKKNLTPNSLVVAPDAGAIKSSTNLAEELDIPIAYMDKKRDLTSGKVKVLGISRKVQKTDAIILDDMIVTGSTLIETAKFLKTQNVKSITVAATHHLYVPGAQEKLNKSNIDRILVTDTIEPKVKSSKLKVISVADLLAEELKKLKIY